MDETTSKVLTTLCATGKGGKVDEIGGPLPDGSGYALVSFPLPDDHWIYQKGSEQPPAPFRMGTNDPRYKEWTRRIEAATRYAVRASTMNGEDMDFDPDAMVQNMLVGMLGYRTEDGWSCFPDFREDEERDAYQPADHGGEG